MSDDEKPPVYVLMKDGMKEQAEDNPFRAGKKPPVSLGLILALFAAVAAYFMSRSQWMASKQHPAEQKQEEISAE